MITSNQSFILNSKLLHHLKFGFFSTLYFCKFIAVNPLKISALNSQIQNIMIYVFILNDQMYTLMTK